MLRDRLHRRVFHFRHFMWCALPWFWTRRIDPDLCPLCRYPKKGLASTTCPECGAELGHAATPVGAPRRLLRGAGVLILALLFTLWLNEIGRDYAWKLTPIPHAQGIAQIGVGAKPYNRLVVALTAKSDIFSKSPLEEAPSAIKWLEVDLFSVWREGNPESYQAWKGTPKNVLFNDYPKLRINYAHKLCSYYYFFSNSSSSQLPPGATVDKSTLEQWFEDVGFDPMHPEAQSDINAVLEIIQLALSCNLYDVSDRVFLHCKSQYGWRRWIYGDVSVQPIHNQRAADERRASIQSALTYTTLGLDLLILTLVTLWVRRGGRYPRHYPNAAS